jgi:hypothetical protein
MLILFSTMLLVDLNRVRVRIKSNRNIDDRHKYDVEIRLCTIMMIIGMKYVRVYAQYINIQHQDMTKASDE